MNSRELLEASLENHLHSGGAEGADLLWGREAKRRGHRVSHYVFKGHRGAVLEDAVVLRPEDLLDADPVLTKVNAVLERSFPAHSDFVTNLLRRNYRQVRDSDRVYAVAGIEPGGRRVIGGTAWACTAFNVLNPVSDEVYVFDSRRDSWFRWKAEWNTYAKMDGLPPRPHGSWTGIGSRDLDERGREMIRRVWDDDLVGT